MTVKYENEVLILGMDCAVSNETKIVMMKEDILILLKFQNSCHGIRQFFNK
jgi:activator of 2-hydroxyglutaryl-CoA dehydratase